MGIAYLPLYGKTYFHHHTMKIALQILVFLLISVSTFAQTEYVGFIGTFSIEFVTKIYSEGAVNAVYAYTRVDEPILLAGTLQKGKLIFFEKDRNDKNSASLSFDSFDEQAATLQGTWTELKTGKQLPVTLNKIFKIGDKDDRENGSHEIIQGASFRNKYFKLIISRAKDGYGVRVAGVKIFEKKTDRLLQTIRMDCELIGINSISIDDYNFDGISDFSVFEQSYAGPNTSSLYFLYAPLKKRYIQSSFSGVSLEFDTAAKRIFEHNQCCAGLQHTTAIYKVVKNKMVLIEQHCYKWDEQKQDLVERKMSVCE